MRRILASVLYGALAAFTAFVVGYEQGARDAEYKAYMEMEAVGEKEVGDLPNSTRK